MAKNKRILYFAITASVLLAAMALSVVAYFSAVKNVDKGYNVSSRDSVVEISSFYDLYSFAKASEYNSQSGASSSSDRKTLRLTADVTLESDVFITADCHIDLNGKSLLLNGNTLTVTHSYHGSNVIFGGSVYPNSRSFEDHTGAVIPEKGGRIVFDTPNSETVIDSVSYLGNDGTSISESAVVRVLWQTGPWDLK